MKNDPTLAPAVEQLAGTDRDTSGKPHSQPQPGLPCPAGVTSDMWKKFLREFGYGCEMWTSEDGCLISLAIVCRDDAPAILRGAYSHWLQYEKPLTMDRLKRRYAYREWVGAEFFDGGTRTHGKVWRIGDDPTPFPVYEYELETPR